LGEGNATRGKKRLGVEKFIQLPLPSSVRQRKEKESKGSGGRAFTKLGVGGDQNQEVASRFRKKGESAEKAFPLQKSLVGFEALRKKRHSLKRGHQKKLLPRAINGELMQGGKPLATKEQKNR